MIMSHIMPRTARTNGLEVSVFLLGVYTFARYVTSCYIHVTERVRVQCCAHLPKKNQFYPLVHAKTTNTVKITNVLNRDKIFLETLLRHARMSILFSYSILADRYYFAYHHFTYSTGFIFFPRTKAIFGVCSFSRFFFRFTFTVDWIGMKRYAHNNKCVEWNILRLLKTVAYLQLHSALIKSLTVKLSNKIDHMPVSKQLLQENDLN